MAFSNYSEIQAALNMCATVKEWESSIHIPEELMPYALQRYADLALGDVTSEVSWKDLKSINSLTCSFISLSLLLSNLIWHFFKFSFHRMN